MKILTLNKDIEKSRDVMSFKLNEGAKRKASDTTKSHRRFYTTLNIIFMPEEK